MIIVTITDKQQVPQPCTTYVAQPSPQAAAEQHLQAYGVLPQAVYHLVHPNGRSLVYIPIPDTTKDTWNGS